MHSEFVRSYDISGRLQRKELKVFRLSEYYTGSLTAKHLQ